MNEMAGLTMLDPMEVGIGFVSLDGLMENREDRDYLNEDEERLIGFGMESEEMP